jgi:hypothetical protein
LRKINKNFINEVENGIFNRALDVDVSLYNLDYSDMPMSYVLVSLSMYQNKDGGFGHALEFDNVNPNSTAYESYYALRIIDEAHYTNYKEDEGLEDISNHLFNYLYNRATTKNDMWLLKESANDKFACALRFKGPDEASLPLSMGIIGYTLYFLDSNKVYYKKALDKLKKFSDKIISLDSLTINELYYFRVLVRALNKINYIDALKFENKYNELLNKLVDTDLEKNYYDFLDLFDGYTKDEVINQKIDLALDNLIDDIKPHGMWEAIHSWGTEQIYPEADSAMIKWVGRATRKAMHYIKIFERIED